MLLPPCAPYFALLYFLPDCSWLCLDQNRLLPVDNKKLQKKSQNDRHIVLAPVLHVSIYFHIVVHLSWNYNQVDLVAPHVLHISRWGLHPVVQYSERPPADFQSRAAAVQVCLSFKMFLAVTWQLNRWPCHWVSEWVTDWVSDLLILKYIERPLGLVTFVTFGQSDEETWSDQKNC